MSSIDERIVSIKFNNAQFEAGIKTTMTSLDGLKKSLNFSAGVKALGDLDAAGKGIGDLKINTAGFDGKVKATIDSANELKKNLKFEDVKKGLNDLDAAGKKVNLKLDPTSFQNGAKAVVAAANTIKNNMNFESVQRGIGNLKMSAQNFSMQTVITGLQTAGKAVGDMDLKARALSFLPISDGAAKAQNSISMLSVAGIAAIAAIGAKAALVGPQMAASLFLDPAKSGLAEYETNLGSIQTIMANTQHEGSTLGDVNGALDELNAYSDKTIYNFAEMAKNIGTFTSAGVKLDDSTNAIKGIANLAALSGSNSEQASTAMYQLSQAMSAGKVGLQDWNSVVNAGMGGKVFQDALMETAKNQGQNVDGLIKKHGSFRESLQEGWITDKVLTETLSKMTGDLTDAQLKAMGYNDAQIVGIQKMAKTAGDAATKIKTFSQLTGTLSEITGSGWAQTWKLILGDFEQAKEMWTSVYGVLGKLVQGSADARNNLLADWNKLGGRTEMIWAVRSAFMNLMAIVTPIKDAFREVFPPTTGKQLYEITQNIRLFINAMKPGAEQINLIKNTFKLLFTIIKIGLSIITGAIGVVVAFFKAFATGGDSIGGSLKPVTDFLAKITTTIQNSTFVKDFFDNMAKGAAVLGGAMARVIPLVLTIASVLGQFFYDISGYGMHYVSKFARLIGTGLVEGLNMAIKGLEILVEVIKWAIGGFQGGLETVFTRINERLASLGRFGEAIANAFDRAMASAKAFWDKIKPIRDQVAKMFQDMGDNIKNAFSDVNFDDTLDMVNTGLLAGLVLLFRGMFKKLLGMGDGMKKGLMEHLDTTVGSINKVLESLTGTLSAMQQNLQADTLMKIALAIGILAISVVVLSLIDSGKLTKALLAIGVMVVILGKAMGMLDKISIGSGFLKIPFIAASMILLAFAILMLTASVVILSKLSWGELLKGLAGISVMLFALSKTVESMAKNPANLIATGVGLMTIALAVRILADSVVIMSGLSIGDLIKGLAGISVVLFVLSKTVESMSKNPADLIATGLGLIAIAFAVKILASAVSDFGTMDIPSLIQGILAVGLLLKILEMFTKGVGDAKNVISTAFAMLILGAALKVIASALMDFAGMSWEDLAKGLMTMVVALDAMSKAMAKVPPNMFTSALGFIAIAIAMKILASALKDMATMSWEEIAKGLTVLAVSLLLMAVAAIAMSEAIVGAAAIMVMAVAISVLAPALKMLGDMSWDQILHGLAALAGIFVVLGLAGLVLTPLVPILFVLGIALAMMGIGLFGVGMGTVLFAVGLIAIASAVAIAGPLLIIFVGSILKLIPLAMEELGKGIVAFAGVIGNAMPVFLNAFVALITTLLTAIRIIFPQLMATLWLVIVGLVDLLVRGIPLLVDAGMKLIVGILKGIADNIWQVVTQAIRIITEFVNGIADNIGSVIDAGVNLLVKFLEGIGNNVQRVTDAAADLIIRFVNGLAATVETKSQEMRDAGLRLAGAIIDGMTGGLASRAKEVADGAMQMGRDAIAAIAGAIDSNSPSKETHKLGTYFGDGFHLGIAALSGKVNKTATSMGTSAVSTLKKSMSGIRSAIESDISTRPTIRPVLDLTDVKKGSGLLDTMIGQPSLSVATSYDQASTLSASARAKAEADSERKKEAGASTGDTTIFNQWNSSPKALSSAEIYRQSNNMMSRFKKKEEATV